MTDTIPNVPRELKPVLAMILNALDRDAADGKQARAEMAAELRAILSAPSPAGVDGLDDTAKLLLPALRQYMHNDGSGLLAGYDLETTHAIIDGMRLGSQKAEWVERATALGQKADQQAQRIGELEGLLREVRLPDDIGRMDIWTRIDSALSAGKDSEQ